MPTATITSKGQITLPIEVRERLGLRRGDRVEFLIASDGTVRLRPLGGSVRDLAGFLYRPGRPPVTLEEMEQGLLEHMAVEDERVRKRR